MVFANCCATRRFRWFGGKIIIYKWWIVIDMGWYWVLGFIYFMWQIVETFHTGPTVILNMAIANSRTKWRFRWCDGKIIIYRWWIFFDMGWYGVIIGFTYFTWQTVGTFHTGRWHLSEATRHCWQQQNGFWLAACHLHCSAPVIPMRCAQTYKPNQIICTTSGWWAFTQKCE